MLSPEDSRAISGIVDFSCLREIDIFLYGCYEQIFFVNEINYKLTKKSTGRLSSALSFSLCKLFMKIDNFDVKANIQCSGSARMDYISQVQMKSELF